MIGADEADRLADRARLALARPGARLEAHGAGYAVRAIGDRRRRLAMKLDETVFALLVEAPGLKPCPDGTWTLIRRPASPSSPSPGRPGVIEGERTVVEIDGVLVQRRANLGESPLAWLARRRDTHGRPWLTPAELMAGERLREDFHRAGLLGRLTMDWSAEPRSGGGRMPGLDPAERGVAAKARNRAALDAVGPGLSPILERICFYGSSLQVAERTLGLPRGAGKTVLKLALEQLARHYGIAR
jgi:hypothetical protein